jgi:hypothetical protein
VNVVERDWWAGPHGEAFDRALNGLLDEDDAADVIALVQESFVPRAIHRGAVGAIESLALAKELLARGDAEAAREHVDAALEQLGVPS